MTWTSWMPDQRHQNVVQDGSTVPSGQGCQIFKSCKQMKEGQDRNLVGIRSCENVTDNMKESCFWLPINHWHCLPVQLKLYSKEHMPMPQKWQKIHTYIVNTAFIIPLHFPTDRQHSIPSRSWCWHLTYIVRTWSQFPGISHMCAKIRPHKRKKHVLLQKQQQKSISTRRKTFKNVWH